MDMQSRFFALALLMFAFAAVRGYLAVREYR